MALYPLRQAQALIPFGVGSLCDFPGAESLIAAGLDAWPIDTNVPGNGAINRSEFVIDDEPRLAHALGVREFLLPPDFRKEGASNRNLRIPFLRFPLWHHCRRCGRMQKNAPRVGTAPYCGYCLNADGLALDAARIPKRYRMQQVRFVAACAAGHLHDFPWPEWVHRGDEGYQPPPSYLEHQLKITAEGGGGLSAVRISCLTCEENGARVSRSLAGAFEFTPANDQGRPESALSRIGCHCAGSRPWVADYANGHCDHPLRAALRGATNLHYGCTHSALWIPAVRSGEADGVPWLAEVVNDANVVSKLHDLWNDGNLLGPTQLRNRLRDAGHFAILARPNIADEIAQSIPLILGPQILPKLIAQGRIGATISLHAQAFGDGTVTEDVFRGAIGDQAANLPDHGNLMPYLEELNRLLRPGPVLVGAGDRPAGAAQLEPEGDDQEAERAIKRDEYSFFLTGDQDTNQIKLQHVGIDRYEEDVRPFFERVVLAHKLRETRVFSGFSRFEGRLPRLTRMNMLRRVPQGPRWWKEQGWLPGYVVRGEGIFLQLKLKRLAEWEQRVAQVHRLNAFRTAAEATFANRPDLPVPTPRYLLLHTLAHVLMLELIFQCGYSSAALRERIYCSDGAEGNPAMAGILIYTASGDSEGTLGGLVRMGKPGNLELVFRRAIDKAGWCSSDPVCMDSPGQGPGNANLAACHSCALVSETSCETGNRFLDRSVLVGRPDAPDLGYFRLIQG